MKNKIMTGLAFVLAAACGSPDASRITTDDLAGGPFASSSGAISSADAEARAVSIGGGRVISTRRKIERGLAVFDVHVAEDSGAFTEIEIVEATGQIVKIEGERGPFDMELNPGGEFLTLGEAFARASELHPGASLVRFELELDDGLWWKYELVVIAGSASWEVELDAKSGMVREDSPASEDELDAWDDHGGDRGNGEVEAGDDHGGDRGEGEVEPGDDNGGDR